MNRIIIILLFMCQCLNLFGQKRNNEKLFHTANIKTFDDGKKNAERIIRKLLREGLIPSMSIVVSKQGQTIWEEGYGYTHLKKKTKPEPSCTLYRIGSVSKSITGVGLAKMQQDNLINWHNSLYHYVPKFPKKEADISLYQLATHTAGIRPYKGKEMMLNSPMSIEQSIGLFQADPLLFAPGEEYLYNSFDFVLLSLAMQNAACIPFETYMEKQILRPLGLYSTFPDLSVPSPDQAQPYSLHKGNLVEAHPVHNFYKLGSGGYLSTATDLNKLGVAILCKNFLQEATQTQMLTAITLPNGKSTNYGIGWQVSSDKAGRVQWGHVGNAIGGYSYFFIYPQEQVVISLLTNVTNPKIDHYLEGILEHILIGSTCIEPLM